MRARFLLVALCLSALVLSSFGDTDVHTEVESVGRETRRQQARVKNRATKAEAAKKKEVEPEEFAFIPPEWGAGDDWRSNAFTAAEREFASQLRVYVYTLPPALGEDILLKKGRQVGSCNSSMYAVERHFHHALLGSDFLESDPAQADVFYVPAYVN